MNSRPATGRLVWAAAESVVTEKLEIVESSSAKILTHELRFKHENFRVAKGQVADQEMVRKILFKEFSGRFSNCEAIRLFDDEYYLPTTDDVHYVLGQSGITGLKWALQRFDCDDFAFGVKSEFSLFAYEDRELTCGFALGVAAGGFNWADTHVACVLVDADHRVWIVEPQARHRINRNGIDLHPSSQCWGCNLLLF
jgi:hypothetical protein